MAEHVINSRYNFLLTKQLTGDEIRQALASIEFADRHAAERCLEHFANDPRMHGWEQYLPILLGALSRVADPDQALSNFERFVHATDDPTALSSLLSNNPRAGEVPVVFSVRFCCAAQNFSNLYWNSGNWLNPRR
jgi:glutamine synthetase adenylyltransferase